MIEKLHEPFAEKLKKVLEKCEELGHRLKIFSGLRTPTQQARIWCQSRSDKQVINYSKKMKYNGAPYLASLVTTNYESGRWGSNNLPGQSWHQWGEAADCVVLSKNDSHVWDRRDKGYKVFYEVSKEAGLYHGCGFALVDVHHVQFRPEIDALKVFKWEDVEKEMLKRFKLGE